MTVLGIADGRALGCSVRVVVTRLDRLLAAKAAVDRLLDEVDVAASRFRQDSELSRINAAPEREVRVSPLLGQAITEALRGARLTGGAVDPTVGRAVRLSGYDADFAAVASSAGAITLVAESVPGWRAVRYDDRSRTLWLPRGVELDLGSSAKALAADLAAAAAYGAADGGGALVSLGGDIAVAGEAPAGGWNVQVSEDSEAEIGEDEETISVTTGGVATSSTTVRRWVRGGVELHHIIDPATGLPASGPWRTVTVVAGTCVDANIASTAAIVIGAAAPDWLDSHRLPARLVRRDGAHQQTAFWPVAERAPSTLSTDSQETNSKSD